MKTLRILAAIIFFATIGTISATAQAGAAQKIAVVDTGAFGDPKGGITRYITAATALNKEFEPRQKKLQDMQTQLQALAKQIDELTRQAAAPNPVVSLQAVDAKRADGSKLQREIQSEQANAQEAFALRQEALVGPIFADIGKAMQDYAKQNGYTVVFDLAQLAQGKMIIAVDKDADITDAFIKFYNARPAGSAAKAK